MEKKCPFRPFLPRKNHYFRKELLNKTIFYSVHPFAHIRQHYFSKYWGNQCMGRPPHLKFFGGPSPQSPRSPPLPRDRKGSSWVLWLILVRPKLRIVLNGFKLNPRLTSGLNLSYVCFVFTHCIQIKTVNGMRRIYNDILK